MGTSLADIVQRGYGVVYEERQTHREEVWRVSTGICDSTRVSVLMYHGKPLVYWDRDSGRAWLSDYAKDHALTQEARQGIETINRSLV